MTVVTEKKPATVTVTVPLEIPTSRIHDLCVGAFEGGSTYWLRGAYYDG